MNERGSPGGRVSRIPGALSRAHGMGLAFTLLELLVVIAIVILLAALIQPMLSKARHRGQPAACLSTLRQIGLALQAYVQDYGYRYPVLDGLPIADPALPRLQDVL